MLIDEEWQEWQQVSQASGNAPTVTAAELLMAVKEADAAASTGCEDPEGTSVVNLSTMPGGSPIAMLPATSDATLPTNLAPVPTLLMPDGATLMQPTSGVFTVAPLTSMLPPTVVTAVPPVNAPPTLDTVNTHCGSQKHTIGQVDSAHMMEIFVNNFGGADGVVQVTK